MSENKSSLIEDKVEATVLYDYYGELLTDHQRDFFEDYMFNDLSLGEIASDNDVSRQAVHDSIRKTVNTLRKYETRLHLVSNTLKTADASERIGIASMGMVEKIKAWETDEKIDSAIAGELIACLQNICNISDEIIGE